MNLRVLIDGDMVVYSTCCAEEYEVNWGGDLWTLDLDATAVKQGVHNKVRQLQDKATEFFFNTFDDDEDVNSEVTLCFTDPYNNFRKILNPDYKANRKDRRKPLGYTAVVQWCKENYKTLEVPFLEADDLLGLNASDNTVLCSGDKDISHCCYGYVYDWNRDTFTHNTKEDMDYGMYYQAIVGDRADHYPGIKGKGEKGAERILANGATWDNVLDNFLAAEQTKEDALLNVRMARILRRGDVVKDKDGQWLIKLFGMKNYLPLPFKKEDIQ